MKPRPGGRTPEAAPIRRTALLAVLSLLAAGIALVPSGAAAETRVSGYFAVRDGTLLRWNAVLPGDGSGQYPVLFTYDGYDAGHDVDPGYVARFVPKGYALVGVSVRGTGCSGGDMDFFEPAQARDGYDAVEWIAQQPWSNGKVAMIGKSYPGITQLFVAAERPPHLVAAAPGHVYGDIYRDVAYPGGIFNYAFAGLWSFVAQPQPGTEAAANDIAKGDAVCAQHLAARTPANARYNAFVQAQEHMFDDELIRERSPYYVADRIEVPLYLFQSWQDEQVGVRGVNVVERLTAPYYLTLSNGDHGMYRTPQSLDRLERFFDHYVRGVDNGFEEEPRVTVWWDAGANGQRAPAWTTTYDAWPVEDVAAWELYPRADGALGAEAPASAELPDAYAYPAGQSSNGAGYGFYPGNNPPTDSLPQTPAPTRLVYTSAPLAEDKVVLGPGNFTFWLASSAPDTDVEIQINEVRPDGKVVYVQKGWLRASHRALDPERSSPFRPFQSHTQLDPLVPGVPVEMNVEIFPMGHAFRAGSRLQLVVQAPSVVPELWGSVLLPAPAVNLLLHDAEHPATLRLPVLAGEQADVPLPACGSLIRQTCR